jgi:hypothetical protein
LYFPLAAAVLLERVDKTGATVTSSSLQEIEKPSAITVMRRSGFTVVADGWTFFLWKKGRVPTRLLSEIETRPFLSLTPFARYFSLRT